MLVECGVLETQDSGGTTSRFRAGDLLCLAGMALRATRNPGTTATRLILIRRRTDSFSRRATSHGRQLETLTTKESGS